MQFHKSIALGFNFQEFCTFLIDRLKQYKDYTIPYLVIYPRTIFPWNIRKRGTTGNKSLPATHGKPQPNHRTTPSP